MANNAGNEESKGDGGRGFFGRISLDVMVLRIDMRTDPEFEFDFPAVIYPRGTGFRRTVTNRVLARLLSMAPPEAKKATIFIRYGEFVWLQGEYKFE